MMRRSSFVSFTFLLSLGSFLLAGFAPASARAAPSRAPGALSDEDRLADGEIDADDLVGRARVGRGVARSPPGGHAWLSLVGFTRQTIFQEREIGGFVVLGLPLDRIARAGTRASISDPPRPRSAPPPPPSPPPPPPPSPPPAAPPPAPSPTPVKTTTEEPVLLVTPRVARVCVAAAWRASGIGVDDARIDAVVSRARWSALLPETRLRAIRYDDARLSASSTTDTTRLYDSTGANIGFEARVTWHFDRLLFADDEPSFERMRLERHDARAKIAGRVLEALFQWQRATLDLRALPPHLKGTREEIDFAIKVSEAEAVLDVLTNGWFSATRTPAPSAWPIVRPDGV